MSQYHLHWAMSTAVVDPNTVRAEFGLPPMYDNNFERELAEFRAELAAWREFVADFRQSLTSSQ